MGENIIQRFYLFFLFLSLIVLVFYAGFLFGNREKMNDLPNTVSSINPNGQSLNTISRIQQRSIEGVVNGQQVDIFGQMFFLVNRNNQTEIVIQMTKVPEKIVVPGRQLAIPGQFSVEIARRVRDDTGQETYSYENLSKDKNNPATIILSDPVNGFRTGNFSGYIDEPIVLADGSKSGIERVVLRSVNNEVTSIFIDPDPDLPVRIRGNSQAGIAGQPAPFFWVKL